MKLELFQTDIIDEPTAVKDPTKAPFFVGFETEDIQGSLNWIQSENIIIIEDLATHSWGKDFYFNDPNGNVIQIAQYS